MRLRRAIYPLILLAATSASLLVVGALWSFWDLFPCRWPVTGGGFVPDRSCFAPLPGLGYRGGAGLRAWVPGAPLVLLAVTSISMMAAVGLAQLVRTRRLRRRLGPREEVPFALAELAGRASVPWLALREDRRPYAFCQGLVRPHVVISTGLVARLSCDELLAVLAHEADHARHRDPLGFVLARLAAAVMAWVPLAGRLAQAFELRAELAADAFAVEVCDRRTLASALLALGGTDEAVAATAPARSRADWLCLRVETLRCHRLPAAARFTGRLTVAALSVGLVAAGVVAWTIPRGAVEPASQVTSMLQTVQAIERQAGKQPAQHVAATGVALVRTWNGPPTLATG
ncbi:MAG: M56 family metallopeptidase [Acidimicrobiales bacterium]